MSEEQPGDAPAENMCTAGSSFEVRHEESCTGDRHARQRPIGCISGILTNIRNGVFLVFFLRVSPVDFIATPGAFTALAFFDFFLHTALSVARVGPNGHVSLYSFPSVIMHIPLMLLAGLWIARLARRNDLALTLSLACLATGIPIDLLAELFDAFVENNWLPTGTYSPGFDSFYPFFGWWALAALTAIFRMTGMPRLPRFGAMAVFAVTLLIPLCNIQRGELWTETSDDSSASNMTEPGSEETIYSQPMLLDNALERLRPGRKGVEDLYFIGFAGYGSQDVFRKELEVIGGLLRSRFDTSGRSLLLVNNPETLLKYPIATATALERSLKRVGQVMNRDEDILLLYLTSHGSEDNHIAAELLPLTLHDIDPSMLRRMLDESGIRWRIVVVSACYSGAFVDALKDDGTLVMTASDASSSSFGCSNDSDFTWFGKALFDDELRRTYSFTTAFSRASASITDREAKEGEKPSHPMVFMGNGIRSRLKRLEERLERLERNRRQPRESGGAAKNLEYKQGSKPC
jgi:hypothetical protein